MKILLINKFFYERGGAESYLFSLMDMLRDHGHEVVPFSMKDPRNFPTPFENFFVDPVDFSKREGIAKDIRKAGRFLYSLHARRQLERLILQEKPDIAHIHNFTHQLTSSVLDVLKKHKIPVVATLHDFSLISPSYLLFDGKKIFENTKQHRYYQAFIHRAIQNSYGASLLAALESYFTWIRRVYVKKISAYIAPSRFLAHKFEEFGFPRAKEFHHIPNMVRLTPEESAMIKTPGKGVFYAGRLSQEKGLGSILAAAKVLSDTPFFIAGTGPMEEELRSNASQNITFLGKLSAQEVRKYIARSAFCVFPSQVYENDPLFVLESLALGKPVIASDLGGIPELVSDMENGLLVDHARLEFLTAAIQKLVYDDKLLSRLQKGARESGKKFSDPEAHYRKIFQVYVSLVSESSAKRVPTRNLYEGDEYLSHNPTWHEEDSEWKAEAVISILENTSWLEQNANPERKLSILDVGCGTGGVLGNLRSKFRNRNMDLSDESLGIDISPDAIKRAQARWSDISFDRQDLSELTPKSHHFDLALMLDVIEHVDDYKKLIREAKKLAPYIVFHIPLDNNANNRLRNKLPKLREEVGHIHAFDPDSALGLVQEQGLTVHDYGYTPVFLATPEEKKTLGNRLLFSLRMFGFRLSPYWTARLIGGLSLLVLASNKTQFHEASGRSFQVSKDA